MTNEKREEIITTLNGVLKDQFDFVPLDKVIKIADALIANGVTIPTHCKDCVHGELASFEKQIGKEPSPESCYCSCHKRVTDPDYFCGSGRAKE